MCPRRPRRDHGHYVHPRAGRGDSGAKGGVARVIQKLTSAFQAWTFHLPLFHLALRIPCDCGIAARLEQMQILEISEARDSLNIMEYFRIAVEE